MPILMLTARSEEVDRVLGLEVGADDYVVKPFSMRELLARVRALLRRVSLDTRGTASSGQTVAVPMPPTSITASVTDEASNPIVCGPLRVDPTAHTASLDDAELDLTPKEFELLQLFAEHPGRAFSREFLVERIWGYEYDGFDRAVDTHITRLRKKLGPFGEKLITVWGVGYRLAL
jgi:DNA-binding response OmpR family regulator